jgi:hypothetical protein
MIVLKEFYGKYVQLPANDSLTPPEVRSNPKLFLFFEDCNGAIDGSHICAIVAAAAVAQNRNRKGFISQNVLAMGTFSMQFLYILAGWEGSASDGQVFEDAHCTDFAARPGKYFLADAGFPTCNALLIPYRGIQYHLWGRVNAW